jgi:hypothetical protein
MFMQVNCTTPKLFTGQSSRKVPQVNKFLRQMFQNLRRLTPLQAIRPETRGRIDFQDLFSSTEPI